MDAIKAQMNKKYLTKGGIPVTPVRVKGDKVIVKVETTGNETGVAKDYQLLQFEESKVNREAKMLLKVNSKPGHPGKRAPREGTLAQLIDPMLFSGGHTVADIAAAVTKKAPVLAKGRDMNANVRCRIVVLRRKGHRLERDAKKRVKIIAPKS
jgi:hypothetical protein